jgi:hypothetical protein
MLKRAVAERPGLGYALDNAQKRLGERQYEVDPFV